MPIEQRQLDTYRELFIHRGDVYAQQAKTGAYFPRRQPVTDAVIRSHLDGQITAGWYAMRPDDTVRWACLDADQENGLAQLQEAWAMLDQRRIPTYLAVSYTHLTLPTNREV